MHHALEDELFLGFKDVGLGDGLFPVSAPLGLETGLVAQRVDEPRLALGLRPHPVQSLW